ncbi:uncharacterized protein N0V89_008751 [Didymosphaeria variabile]|uniref:DUF7626 domain-containing protein n=1 Tax=Didymosphaeria variabile TaxID=1932322 RepID=A0A9W8XGI5_9PLEO|nr:uncharacterized protein N0V89_008751 [Didymosphaeria variabile]KAJ4350130.1 hypothetical protein N0V89_008751 [Didymosphaeria variabile]
MAPKGTTLMLELSDEDIGGDNHSVASFGDDGAPVDEDFASDSLPAAPSYDEDDITFTRDDVLPPSDSMTFDADGALLRYDEYARSSSPAPLQGYSDYIGVNDPDSDHATSLAHNDVYNEDAAPGAKRAKTTLAVRSKVTQPAHFHQSTNAAERSAKRVTVDESRSYHIDDDAGISYQASSRVAGTFGRRNREKGSTLPAYHKKVSHELDSDDELMMDMREKGFTDKQIAFNFANQGRTKYDSKSISTRIQRIKLVQSQHVDFELENGMREWKLEDDQLLLRAYDLASIEIAYEIERLRAWRFKKTAEWMRRMNKVSVFSGKACHARYSSLLDGTATIPCDVDDDPAQRRAAMEVLRQQKEDEREAEREAKEAEEAERERIKDEAAVRQAKILEEKAEKRAQDTRAASARATTRATKQTFNQRQAEDHLKKKKAAAADKLAKKAATEAERKFREEFALKHFKHVTEDTPDPRRVLDVVDLRNLCRARKINDHVMKKDGETKKVLLQRLRDADERLRVAELRELVKARGIPHGGTKVQMKYQLALCAARSCESFVQDGQDDEGADGGDEAEGGMEVDLMVE